MNGVLLPIKWRLTLMHLDDIIVYFGNAKEHISHVQAIMWVLQKSEVTLILKKFNFFTENVDHTGHVIRPGRLNLTDQTAHAIR